MKDFPDGGANRLFRKFFAELYENKRIWTERGRNPSA